MYPLPHIHSSKFISCKDAGEPKEVPYLGLEVTTEAKIIFHVLGLLRDSVFFIECISPQLICGSSILPPAFQCSGNIHSQDQSQLGQRSGPWLCFHEYSKISSRSRERKVFSLHVVAESQFPGKPIRLKNQDP